MEKTNVFVMAAAALTFTPVPDGCAGSGGGPNTKPGLLLRTAPSEIQAQDDGREFAVYLAFGLYCGLSLYAENFPARAPARVFPPERKDFPPEGKVFPLEEKDFPPEEKDFPLEGRSFPPEEKDFPLEGKDFPPEEKDFPLEGKDFPPEGRSFPPEEKDFPLEEKDFPPEGKGFLPGENSFSPEGKRPYTLNNGE